MKKQEEVRPSRKSDTVDTLACRLALNSGHAEAPQRILGWCKILSTAQQNTGKRGELLVGRNDFKVPNIAATAAYVLLRWYVPPLIPGLGSVHSASTGRIAEVLIKRRRASISPVVLSRRVYFIDRSSELSEVASQVRGESVMTSPALPGILYIKVGYVGGPGAGYVP